MNTYYCITCHEKINTLKHEHTKGRTCNKCKDKEKQHKILLGEVMLKESSVNLKAFSARKCFRCCENLINEENNSVYCSKCRGQPVPKSDVEFPGIDQLPFEGIAAIGEIFAEGEIKYGKDNWKKQPSNTSYNAERCRHALKHLFMWANGDRSEPHLAKVAWFCVTQIWREKNE